MKLILTGLILVLSGCSVFKHKDYISVDSYPRGKIVKRIIDDEVKEIGTTPLFDRVRLSDEPKYSFDGGVPISPEEKCGMQWTDPIVDRIPLFKKLVPDFLTNMMGTFTPINLVKGGKYECTSLVRKYEKGRKEEAPQCRKFLVVPPPTNHSKTSKQMTEDWINQNFEANKGNCDEVIKPRVVKENLEFYGLDHLNRSYGMKYMMYGLMARLGDKLGATHLVFLHNNESQVQPAIYDIHSRLQNAKEMEESFQRDEAFESKSAFLDQVNDAFRLIPNNFSLRFKLRRWLHLQPEESEKFYSRRNSQVKLPPSIVLSNIEYPLESWGTNFRFSPSVSYKTWDRDYDIKFASLMMVLKLFGHTPIGTFIGRIGGGVAYTDVARIGGGYEQKQGLAVAQWGGEYYKFIGERVFLKLGFRRNELRKNKVVDGNFHLKGLSEIFVGLGFYFPEMNTKIRSFFYE